MRKPVLDALATLTAGTLFGFGLAYSTMIRPESILAFLTFTDLGLLCVLAMAVALDLVAVQGLSRLLGRPLWGEAFQTRPFRMDRKSLAGGIIFGLGWGICGVCPGPALAGIGAGSADLLLALVSMLVGALLHGLWAARSPGAAAEAGG